MIACVADVWQSKRLNKKCIVSKALSPKHTSYTRRFTMKKIFFGLIIVIFFISSMSACNKKNDTMTLNKETGIDSLSAKKDSSQVIISETAEYASFVIEEDKEYVAPDGFLLTMTVDGVEKQMLPGTYEGKIVITVTETLRQDSGMSDTVKERSSFWPETYRTGIFVDEGTIVESKSVFSAIGDDADASDSSASGFTVVAGSPEFSGLIISGEGTEYTLRDSTIELLTDGDGTPEETNDFVGLGSAIAVFNGVTLTIDNVDIRTIGVAKPATFTDSSYVLVKNSSFIVEGGELHEDYRNTADISVMVSPPWVLGISGNARGTNLVGEGSVNVFVDSDFTTAGWGVLSSDTGSGGRIGVINSTLSITGDSGYGIYAIGGVDELFAGTEFDVATYALIMTGGTAEFTSYTGGDTYDFTNQIDDSIRFKDVGSNMVEEGKTVNTTVSSQFGIMSHNTGEININKGTKFDTKNATFLVKNGKNIINVDRSELNPEDKILVQMIDNDDEAVGAVFEDGTGPIFNTVFTENEGWPLVSENTSVGEGVESYFTNVNLTGDMYNATGYQYTTNGEVFNAQPKDMSITLGTNAALEGIITSSRARHVWMEWIEDADDTQGGYYTRMENTADNAASIEELNGRYSVFTMEGTEYLQATEFTIDSYYNLGQVINEAYNGSNATTNVTLKDGATWTVTGTCYLDSLTIDSESTINGIITINGSEMIPMDIVANENGTVSGNITITAEEGEATR